jgi:hypothetical protein
MMHGGIWQADGDDCVGLSHHPVVQQALSEDSTLCSFNKNKNKKKKKKKKKKKSALSKKIKLNKKHSRITKG